MLRILFFLPLSFLLSSCITTSVLYYGHAERYYISGTLDTGDENIDKYDLIYLFDGDTADVGGIAVNKDFDGEGRNHLKRYYTLYCNVLVRASDFFACPDKLRGKVDVDIILRNNESGKSYLLTKELIDMNAYPLAIMRTEVFVGTDTALYVARKNYDNIDWNRVEPIFLKDENRTIYHYTVKFRDTRDEFFTPSYNEEYLVEFP